MERFVFHSRCLCKYLHWWANKPFNVYLFYILIKIKRPLIWGVLSATAFTKSKHMTKYKIIFWKVFLVGTGNYQHSHMYIQYAYINWKQAFLIEIKIHYLFRKYKIFNQNSWSKSKQIRHFTHPNIFGIQSCPYRRTKTNLILEKILREKKIFHILKNSKILSKS